MKEDYTVKSEILERRLELEKTISKIFSRFVGVFNIDDAINHALADMGFLSGADRAYLFLFSKDQKIMDNTHEWCAEGVTPLINNLQNISYEMYRWWMNKLRKGEVIQIDDVSKLPEEAEAERIAFESQNIKSVLAFPIYVGGELSGYIGFDNVTKTGQWNYDDFALLRTSSEIIGRALERKRTEEELREGWEKYRILFEESNDAIFIADIETGSILDANRAAERLLGIPQKEIIGMHQAQLHPQGKVQYYQEKFRKHIEAGRIVDFNAEVIRSDGSIVPVSISASVMMFKGRKLLQGIFRDITNLRRTEEELQKYGEQLEDQVQESIAELVNANKQLRVEIAERKRAEKALEESEKRYRELVDLLPQTVFETDEKANIIFANRRGFDSFGYTQEDFDKGLSALQMLITEDRKRANENILRVLKGEQLGVNEYTALRKDGSTFPVIIHSSPIMRENKTAGLRGIIIDITERKRAEEELRMSEERYRGLFEDSPISLWEEDFSKVKAYIDDLRDSGVKDFRIYFENHPSAVAHCASMVKVVDINKSTLELYQAGSKEELLSDLKQFFGKKSLDMFKEELMALAEGKTIFESESTIKTMRGERKHVQLKWSIAPGYEKTWSKVFVSVIDMTERKRMEEALRESEEKYRTLIETSPDPIVLTDMNSKILMVNQQALKLHGYDTEEELVGKNGFDFIAPEDHQRAIEIMRQIFEKGYMRNVEYKLVKKDGTIFSAETSASLILDAQGNPKAIVGMSRDITERKSMEEALKKTEHEKALILESIAEHVVYQDTECKIIWTNRAAGESVGLAPDKLVGRYCYEVWQQRSEPCEGCPIVKTFKTGRSEEGEMTTPDGRVWFIRAYPARDENGNLIGAVEVTLEITERKRAEEALRESEAKYSALVESSKDGIVILQDGVIKFINTSSLELVGYTPEVLIGANFLDFIAPNYRELVLERYTDRMVGKEVPSMYEIEILMKDGTTLPVELNAVRINFQGKPADMAFIRNITERKRMEKELKEYAERLEEIVEDRTRELMESEEKFRTILASSPDAITVTDLYGNVVECNQATLDVHGFSSKEEVIGQSAFEYIAEKDKERAAENLVKTLEEGSLKNVEYTLRTKDGREFPAELSASVMRDASGNPVGFVGITKDITERKLMEEALLRSERLATIGEVATMVGHDLRNPLTGIAGAVFYLKKKLGSEIDEKTREMLELIEKDIDYSNKIINDLLEYSKEVQLEFTETNPRKILNDALSLVEIPEKICLVNLTTEDARLNVDVQKMERVFTNIIKNSIDAMPRDGELKITSKIIDGKVKIVFTDTGLGIRKDIMDKIGTPLFTTKAKGLGVGLAICKRIVEAHGGSILVESMIGKGTTITVTLPIKTKIKGET